MQNENQNDTTDAPKCPTNKRHEGDLVGCGSSSVTDADEEGFHDCSDCGLFFKVSSNGGGKRHED